MKEKIKFLIGSKAFFSNYPDFNSKDTDVLYIMDTWNTKSNTLNFRNKGMDRFLIKEMSKQEMIDDILKSNVPMKAGKFLVPEFAKYMDMTIDDLKQLSSMFENMDDRHSYEKIIYDSYIINNDFVLTESQRNAAYEEYKSHKNIK